jgi:hypothetical protein
MSVRDSIVLFSGFQNLKIGQLGRKHTDRSEFLFDVETGLKGAALDQPPKTT